MTTDSKPNYSINLPNNYLARKEYNHIYFELKKEKKTASYKKVLQKINYIDDMIIELIEEIDTDSNDVCRLNSNNIKLPLYLRNKKNGDYIYGKKKIKDIFIDSKLPKEKRETYPLLVDSDDKILWIPNIKKSKYNVKKHEFCDIILTSHKEGEK